MDLGKESSDDEVLSKPALEYYRKHSLNPDLGKYFTGTSTSVISEYTPRERRLGPPLNEVEIIIDVETEAQEMENKGSQTDLEESISNKNLSPTSSVASIKKLEWDNGADIGYDNCRKTFLTQKSSSLPILSNADTNRKVELLQKAQSKHINKVWSAGNVEHLKLVPNLSSSSSSNSPEESPKDSPKLYNLESSSTSYALMDNKSSTTSSSGALPEKASKCTLSSESSKIMETESSTRTSSKKSARSHESTSSSQDKHIDEKHKKFSETLKFLKQKIGYPDAESTPKLPETTSLAVSDEKYSETPLQKKPDKPPRKNVNVEFLKRKESKSYENLPITTKSDDKVLCLKNSKKSVKLCPTKPSCIECIDNKIPEKKAVLNKVSQTSFGVKKSTQSVQTEEADDKLIHFIECPDNSRENQKIIYWEHADLDNNGLSKSSNTQTDSDLISNCYSFVYLLGKPPLEYPAQSSTDKENKTITSQKIQKDRQIHSTSASSFQQRRNSTSDTESILTDSRLSDILSKNLSKDINVDIEKSIDILRKLLKSKRYDQGTKNRYIRKIVKKLLDSKYTPESSASSELFQPRRCEGMAPPANIGSGDQPKATNLQANLPWYPAQREIKHRSPVKRHKILDNKITNSEILPGTSKYDKMLSKTSKDDNVIKPVILKNPRSYNPNKNFTLTNNELLITHNYSSSSPTYKNETSPPTDSPLLQSSPKDLDTSPRNTESHSTTNNSTENRNENWKEEKTQSEKLLEGVRKFTGHGDQLVNFAKSERQHQISWINNEIEHLVMLKEMLEKKKKPKLDSKKKASLMEVLQKVHVEDICGHIKNPQVYTLSHNPSPSKNKSEAPIKGPKNKPLRKHSEKCVGSDSDLLSPEDEDVQLAQFSCEQKESTSSGSTKTAILNNAHVIKKPSQTNSDKDDFEEEQYTRGVRDVDIIVRKRNRLEYGPKINIDFNITNKKPSNVKVSTTRSKSRKRIIHGHSIKNESSFRVLYNRKLDKKMSQRYNKSSSRFYQNGAGHSFESTMKEPCDICGEKYCACDFNFTPKRPTLDGRKSTLFEESSTFFKEDHHLKSLTSESENESKKSEGCGDNSHETFNHDTTYGQITDIWHLSNGRRKKSPVKPCRIFDCPIVNCPNLNRGGPSIPPECTCVPNTLNPPFPAPGTKLTKKPQKTLSTRSNSTSGSAFNIKQIPGSKPCGCQSANQPPPIPDQEATNVWHFDCPGRGRGTCRRPELCPSMSVRARCSNPNACPFVRKVRCGDTQTYERLQADAATICIKPKTCPLLRSMGIGTRDSCPESCPAVQEQKRKQRDRGRGRDRDQDGKWDTSSSTGRRRSKTISSDDESDDFVSKKPGKESATDTRDDLKDRRDSSTDAEDLTKDKSRKKDKTDSTSTHDDQETLIRTRKKKKTTDDASETKKSSKKLKSDDEIKKSTLGDYDKKSLTSDYDKQSITSGKRLTDKSSRASSKESFKSDKSRKSAKDKSSDKSDKIVDDISSKKDRSRRSSADDALSDGKRKKKDRRYSQDDTLRTSDRHRKSLDDDLKSSRKGRITEESDEDIVDTKKGSKRRETDDEYDEETTFKKTTTGTQKEEIDEETASGRQIRKEMSKTEVLVEEETTKRKHMDKRDEDADAIGKKGEKADRDENDRVARKDRKKKSEEDKSDKKSKEMELQESASDQSVKLRKKGKRDKPSTEVDRKSQRMEKEIELSEKDKTKIRQAKDESPESSPSEDDRLAKTKRKEKEDKSIEKDQEKRRKDKEVSPEPSPSESDRSQKSKRSGTEGDILEKDKDKKRKDKDVSPESSPSESDRTKTKRKGKEDELPEKAKDQKRKDKDVSESSPSESDRLSKTKQKEKEDKSSVDKKRKTKDVSPESSPSESDAKRKDGSPEEEQEKRRRASFESDRAVGSRSKEKDKDKIRKPKDASPESSPSESDKRDKDAKEKSKKALEKKKADELPYSPEISPSEDEERGSRKKKSQTKDKDKADKYSMTRLDDDDSPKGRGQKSSKEEWTTTVETKNKRLKTDEGLIDDIRKTREVSTHSLVRGVSKDKKIGDDRTSRDQGSDTEARRGDRRDKRRRRSRDKGIGEDRRYRERGSDADDFYEDQGRSGRRQKDQDYRDRDYECPCPEDEMDEGPRSRQRRRQDYQDDFNPAAMRQYMKRSPDGKLRICVSDKSRIDVKECPRTSRKTGTITKRVSDSQTETDLTAGSTAGYICACNQTAGDDFRVCSATETDGRTTNTNFTETDLARQNAINTQTLKNGRDAGNTYRASQIDVGCDCKQHCICEDKQKTDKASGDLDRYAACHCVQHCICGSTGPTHKPSCECAKHCSCGPNAAGGRGKDPEGSYRDRDGILRDRDGNIIPAEGTYRDRDGVLRDRDGNIVPAGGTYRDKDGVIRDIDGNIVTADGTYRDRDGNLRNKSGYIVNADGTYRDREGILRDRDGKVVSSDRAGNLRDGSFTDTDGTYRDRDGNLRNKDGDIVNKDGNIVNKDGIPRDKNGNIIDQSRGDGGRHGGRRGSKDGPQATLTIPTKINICGCSDSSDSDSESDSEESSSTDSENTGITCVCCKKKAIPSSKWFNLYQKLNERPPQLCSPCYKVGQGNTYQKPYSQGGHNCVCYSMVNSGTLNEIRQTVGEMQRMQAFEEFAEICSTAKKPKHRRCKHCKCKVNPKYKNGIAYQLTLEDTHVSEMSSPKKKKKKNLNEIKIKIPVTSKKKHKNKENNKRKDRSEKGQNTEDDKEAQADEDDTKSELTLQDYLAQNMPGFVSAADSRRKTVLDAVNQRAADKDDRKLKFLDSDSNKESSSKKKAGFSLFSEKEMKSMTRKNYKQLAEVKKMKRDEKELRLRQSNRLITNLFSKRLQKNVLEGKRSLPLDAKVVNY